MRHIAVAAAWSLKLDGTWFATHTPEVMVASGPEKREKDYVRQE